MESKQEEKKQEKTVPDTEEQRKKEESRKKRNEEKKKAKEEKIKQKQEKQAKEKAAKEAKEKKDKEQKEKEVDYYKSNAKLVRPNKNVPVYKSDTKQNILITSALPYVNNVPHLGTLIGCVMSADVFARFSRLMGKNVLYVCGTDEYGTATETKALEEKVSPKELCDKYHKIHDQVYQWFDIDFDYFGRTSTPQQTVITQDIFKHLKDNGYVKKHEVEQYKCTQCNMVLSDRYIIGTCYHGDCKYEEARGDQCDKCGKLCNALELINPKCKLCKNTPIKVKSFHYFIQLPDVQDKLKAWVEKASKEGNWSENAKSITNAFINDGLKERCITRDLKWGVPVPEGDDDMKDKVFYVWFDAPIGYLSITANFIGDKWAEWWKDPEHVKLYQFMGKDNVTFHTVIFPTTLIGTGENYTKVHHLSTTEYLNYEGTKFSKSKGTGVFGDMAESTGFPSEVWRYYLLAMRPEVSDTDFKWDDFQAKNNNELLANLGNLVNRVLVFTHKNFEGKIPKFSSAKFEGEKDIEFLKELTTLVKTYIKYQENTDIKDALKTFMEISSLGNGFLQAAAPWNLLKKGSEHYDIERAETVLYILCALVRLIGALGEPFMPSFSAKLYEIMNIKYEGEQCTLLKTVTDFIEGNKENDYMFLVKAGLVEEGKTINAPLPLFKKISDKELADMKARFGGSQEPQKVEDKKEEKKEKKEKKKKHEEKKEEAK